MHPTVVLVVTIDATGTVAEAEVEHSAGEDFDQAAVEAVRQWRFEPARRGEEAVPSRVRLAVHFELPAFDLHHAGTPEDGHGHVHDGPPAEADDAGGEAPEEPPSGGAPPPEPDEGEVFGARAEVEVSELRNRERSASDFELGGEVLAAAPRREAGDLLAVAPGVFVSRPEGDAVAHRITLRGFDAEHGQDVALSVGGLPINQPAHIHGQGYADLGFLIPETVRSVRVTEGVYDPRQGDFAIAGSADFVLGVEDRGVRFRSSVGSFGTFRQLALWAPDEHEDDTFGAATFSRTDGFGENRAGRSGAILVQYGHELGHGERLRLLGSFHAARSGLAGVVRSDDLDSGRLGFYDVYDLPTATAQGASSARAQLALTLEHRGEGGSNAEAGLWLLFQDFRIEENFTGFTRRSTTNPDWVGRGDLIEQRNRDLGIGAFARYRSAAYHPWPWLNAHLELGATGRVDRIDQGQNLLQEPQGRTWDELVDAEILAVDVGVWADVDVELGEYFEIRGGARADLLFYDVDDALGNRIPAFRREDFIVGFRRSAIGVAAGPRVTLEAKPPGPARFFVAYGEGFRSPQARTLADGEPAPFTKVRSVDVGARAAFGEAGELLSLSLSGFFARLTDDVAFDPAEGRLERLAPTRRLGFTFNAESRPRDLFTAAFSLTYVDAVLLEPPPASVADPNPPFEEGQGLPFVPPWVARLSLGTDQPLLEREDHTLRGRLAFGYNQLGRRPLPFGQRAAPFGLVDLSAHLDWETGREAAGIELTAGVEIYNLGDARYAASEFFFVSNWDPETPPTRLPARHTAAGSPRTILFTFGGAL